MLKNNIATIAVIFGFAVIINKITMLENKIKVIETVKENEIKEHHKKVQKHQHEPYDQKKEEPEHRKEEKQYNQEPYHQKEEKEEKEEDEKEEDEKEEDEKEEEEKEPDEQEPDEQEPDDQKDSHYEHGVKDNEIARPQTPPSIHFWKWNIFM